MDIMTIVYFQTGNLQPDAEFYFMSEVAVLHYCCKFP